MVNLKPIVEAALKNDAALNLALGYKQGTDTGTANNYILSITGITAYADGLLISFTPENSNTGASTVKINALVAKPIIGVGAGAIISGQRIDLKYDATAGGFKFYSKVYQQYPDDFIALPAVSWRELDKRGDFYTDDAETAREYYFVIDAWSKGSTSAMEAAVDDIMAGLDFTLQSSVDLYESDTKIRHKASTYATKRMAE